MTFRRLARRSRTVARTRDVRLAALRAFFRPSRCGPLQSGRDCATDCLEKINPGWIDEADLRLASEKGHSSRSVTLAFSLPLRQESVVEFLSKAKGKRFQWVGGPRKHSRFHLAEAYGRSQESD
jgi:hypothetical protein